MKRKSVNSKQWSVISSQRLVRWLLIGLVVLTAWQYCAEWIGEDTLLQAEALVLGLNEKPYVYRALVPFVARLVWMMGLRADLALALVVILCAVGLVYGIKYLITAFR